MGTWTVVVKATYIGRVCEMCFKTCTLNVIACLAQDMQQCHYCLHAAASLYQILRSVQK